MRKLFAKCVATAALACAAVAAPAAGLPGPVVDTTWLAANLDKVQVVEVRSDVRPFTAEPRFGTDASGKKTLVEVGGHIPGARLIDMKTMRTERIFGGQPVKYMIPEQAAFEKAVQAAGVDAGKPIVIVPVGTELAELDDALRVLWQFKVYGEDDIAVLDGGMASWLAENRPYSTQAAAARTGSWRVRADRSARYLADSQDVAKAMADKSAALVDSRDAKQFHGLIKRDYVADYGHLDGARLYATELMVKSAGGALKFMSPNTYRALMKAEGIDPAAPAITYCNSGHLAAGTWFLLSEVLGNPATRLYDGSLHQWTLEKRQLVGAVPLQ
ncbi:MAG: rhodanese-like domain-containing protein [Burkholderiaceae bacterium]|uniref:sulfurtransferase n=1 Tax=Hydrogenophaga sp. TaxID=1904254 RepID=UPI002761830C|nr:rhodanese-like domain-containing protein [Hydrogenophaga sp.]MDP2065308.1 rhodanese-like domain-containing protein [Burkholderiaceae bacterium]MDZ4145402.1 rhodanese-like domain-containing protein [Burkholderiales bacterium]MDZ4396107.1 rhodanese-like domain-containing protein [Hydrogenophaga sp.]